jgi:hypothetical protein
VVSQAEDFGPALSQHTGAVHELTDRMITDIDMVMPYIRDFDEVYDADIDTKTYE